LSNIRPVFLGGPVEW